MLFDNSFADLTPSLKRLCIGNVLFWSLSTTFLVLDLIARDRPDTRIGRRLRSCKLQPEKSLLSNAEYADIALVAAFNMFLLSPLLAWVDQKYLSQLVDDQDALSEADAWVPLREVGCIVGCLLVLDIWFYFTHLLFHKSTWLYKTVHKMHHKWTAPCSMTAIYAHPIEFIFSNVLGIEVGLKLTNAHPYTAYAFYSYVLISTCWDHSGYRFVWFGENDHDMHHEFFQYNYGASGLMDHLCGTWKSPSLIKRRGEKKTG